jgi:hypothetical protein
MKQFIALLFTISFCSNNSFAQKVDSLYAKRIFLATSIYQNGTKLSDSKIKTLYTNFSQPSIKYKWSKILKPVGPVVAIGGVGLAYIALKGVDATAVVDGKNVDYKIRSLPKLLMGLGLVAGGISMIESSNELAQHSVDIYNSMLPTANKVSYIDRIKFGITENNAVGFTVSLK